MDDIESIRFYRLPADVKRRLLEYHRIRARARLRMIRGSRVVRLDDVRQFDVATRIASRRIMCNCAYVPDVTE